MRTLTACLLLLVALPALAWTFPPHQPTARLAAGNNVEVRWNQSEYGTSSEICLWPSNGGTSPLGTPPLRKISGASGGTATFAAVGRGLYYVTVISEQTRLGSGSEQLQIP